MSLSNSFHSSAKKHAISSAGKLASVELHNSRGYYSFYYDEGKIHALTGTPGTISNDVEQYINATFSGAVDAYNKKQKRQDRRITETPFEYFAENKSLDIANEVIFQLGGKEFWDRWRTDTIIQTTKGERVLKDFPEEVKKVMDEIFTLQGKAYEKIYETHGTEILARIQTAKEEAQKVIDGLSEEEKKEYEQIFEKPVKGRKRLIDALDKPEKYQAYTDAAATLSTIKKLRLQERIEAGDMHIKLLNNTSHYDEFSPHGHGVSVCWTSGYKTGLENRVAKSVVLNQWSLAVIQDRLREIAKEEMEKYPEIFQGEVLAEKGKGRNLDYSVEQIQRQAHSELKEQTEAAKLEVAAAQSRKEELLTEIEELEKKKSDAEGDANEAMERTMAETEAAAEAARKAEQAQQEALEAQRQMVVIQEQLGGVERQLAAAKDSEADAKRQAAEYTQKAQQEQARYDELFRVNDANLKILEEQEQEIQRQEDILQLIYDYDEYEAEAETIDEHMDLLEAAAKELPAATRMFKSVEANAWMERMKQILQDLRRLIDAGIKRLKIFESRFKVEEVLSEPAEKRAAALDEQIFGASTRAGELAQDAPKQPKRESPSR